MNTHFRHFTQFFDARDFRLAVGHFATGVVIVTACDSTGQPVGLTISSFNTVSAEPPLVLFSIDRKALSLAALKDARCCAINILDTRQRHLSDRFSRSRSDKWTGVDHSLGRSRTPILSGALANFECIPYATYDGGDHFIFVVRVVSIHCGAGRPLIFFKGAYRDVTEDVHLSSWPLSLHY